jgi:hypothetical protein
MIVPATRFRAAAEKIADDVTHEVTGLCAHCDPGQYDRYKSELTETLTMTMQLAVDKVTQAWPRKNSHAD